jgi:NAD(P)-dependent dehydrogenase (short-subunit alcohol dehydrogenase family)
MAADSATSLDLSGKIAVITGAGSGIGRAMAQRFAAAGAAILVNDIIGARAHETVALVRGAGGTAEAAVGDIAEEATAQMIVGEARRLRGRIDILCNNAGIIDNVDLPQDTPTELWNRVLAVNITGYFFVTRAVLPMMLERRFGRIVNTASQAGLRGGAAGLAYTVSKHGVVGLTRNVAWAHRHDGIRCNAICPGGVETNIVPGGLETLSAAGLARLQPVLAMANITQPQTMANVALFLASDAAEHVNGAIVPVDGGWWAG